ncbi:hypothetical protein ACL00Q_06585 [Curtobacterium flaccumfaciens pv. flaccumfaciens]|uniref:hypothetical protein n=1 Tax=Curtobacterium flaccumfaciens TaxID=2035 RepID=UPI0039A388DC
MRELDDTVRRARRRTIVIATVGFVIGALVGVLLTTGDPLPMRILASLGIGLSIGGLGGAFSLLPTTLRLGREMQTPGRTFSQRERRTILRAVYSGRPIEPRNSDLALRARESARVASTTLPVTLAQTLLLFAGIAGPQLPNLLRDDAWSAGFSRIFVAAIIVASVGFSMSFRRNIRGARRYLAASREP